MDNCTLSCVAIFPPCQLGTFPGPFQTFLNLLAISWTKSTHGNVYNLGGAMAPENRSLY